MQFVGSFDPSSAINGQMTIGTVDPNSKVLLYNLSIVSILLNFEDGSTDILHAGEAKWWQLNAPTPSLAWKQYAVLNAQPGPISTVTITTYDGDEEIVGTYPMSLIYILNLGNAIPLSTSATSITNSGNTAGTNVITAQVSGDGNNAVILTNDGQLTLGDALHPGKLSTTEVDITTLNVTTANTGTENVGTINGTTLNIGTINCTAENLATLNITSVLNLLKGSLTRVFFFQGSNTQSFAHNFGVAPSCVLINYAGNFGTAPTQAIAWFSTDSNNITVVGQTGYNYQGIAIHS